MKQVNLYGRTDLNYGSVLPNKLIPCTICLEIQRLTLCLCCVCLDGESIRTPGFRFFFSLEVTPREDHCPRSLPMVVFDGANYLAVGHVTDRQTALATI